MTHRRPDLLLPLLLAACGAPASILPDADLARLHVDAEAHGGLVYEGAVTPQDSDAPLFRYERRVVESEGRLAATHLTFELADGRPVILQHAEHDAAYRLRRYEEVHRQTGVRSEVHVAEDGSVELIARRGDRVERHREGAGPPVVVGPTLFGFALQHLDRLRAGERTLVRFATPDQGRTYTFELRLGEPRPDGQLVVLMEAANVFVRLGIAAMRIVVDPETGNVTSYHGRVPARRDGGAFDADVTYRYPAGRFR